MANVTRFSVSMDPKLLEEFDKLIKESNYTNRSEALRDVVGDFIKSKRNKKEVTGIIRLSYDARANENISKIKDEYPCLILSSMQTYLDKHTCSEVLVIKGNDERIKKFSDKISQAQGIRECKLSVQ
jgi:CopG family nickel-responsive transcriptional regulator